MKNNNTNSHQIYHSKDFSDDRHMIYSFIKNNPGKTAKEILYALELELNNGGRITELYDAGYINRQKDPSYNKTADRIYPAKAGYDPADFSAEKLKERQLLKTEITKNDSEFAKIGKMFFDICMREPELFSDGEREGDMREIEYNILCSKFFEIATSLQKTENRKLFEIKIKELFELYKN